MTLSRTEEIRRVADEWEFDKRIPAPRAARLLKELLRRVDELERGIGDGVKCHRCGHYEASAARAEQLAHCPSCGRHTRWIQGAAENEWRVVDSVLGHWCAIGPWRESEEEARRDAEHGSMRGALPEPAEQQAETLARAWEEGAEAAFDAQAPSEDSDYLNPLYGRALDEFYASNPYRRAKKGGGG
jgi:hypothetical protein